jgi:predicted Zn-dependent protease
MVNFTRENEYEADRVGMDLLQRAQFDPNGMVEFFGIMSKLSGPSEIGNIEYLRTHPLNNNRIAEAADRASRLGHGRNQFDDFLLFKDYLLYNSSDYLPDQGSEFLRALRLTLAADYRAADAKLAALYQGVSGTASRLPKTWSTWAASPRRNWFIAVCSTSFPGITCCRCAWCRYLNSVATTSLR